MKRIWMVCLLLMIVLCGCESAPLEESKQYQYYYQTLEENEKQAYLKMYHALMNLEESVVVKDVEKDMLETLYVMVKDDHPEIFWAENRFSFSTRFDGKQFELHFTYPMNMEEVKSVQEQIEKETETLMSTLNETTDEFDKVRKIYTYVITKTKYVSKAQDDQNIQSVFLNGQSVCAGYARAVQYLCLKAGIDCTYIEGYGIKEQKEKIRHAWNMLKIKDVYYYLDATWGDVENDKPHACNAYFLMSSDEMLDQYEPANIYEKSEVYDASWFVEDGSYFKTWDSEQIRKLWQKANGENKTFIEMKCTPEVYEEIADRIEQKGEMYEILRQNGVFVNALWCKRNDASNTIEIYY